MVSAGAFNSPQLLELSGIGQPERQRNLGIEVRNELAGVGKNLRDHYVPRTRWLVGKKGITFNDRGRGLSLAHQMLRGRACWRRRPPRSARSCARATAWGHRT